MVFCEQRARACGVTLDPSCYVSGPHQRQEPIDKIDRPHVQHVHLRDSSKADRFQVRVGQGEIDYGKLVAQLQTGQATDRALVGQHGADGGHRPPRRRCARSACCWTACCRAVLGLSGLGLRGFDVALFPEVRSPIPRSREKPRRRARPGGLS